MSIIKLRWLKIHYNVPLRCFVVFYSSLHMWFNLPHHVVQPAPLWGNLNHSQLLSSLSICENTIYVENLRHSVIMRHTFNFTIMIKSLLMALIWGRNEQKTENWFIWSQSPLLQSWKSLFANCWVHLYRYRSLITQTNNIGNIGWLT